jgi:hypothetical protein
MLGQLYMDLDTRQDANAGQLKIFGCPTTDFFGMQGVPWEHEMTLTGRESPPLQTERKDSAEILDKIFKDYAGAWEKLAKL